MSPFLSETNLLYAMPQGGSTRRGCDGCGRAFNAVFAECPFCGLAADALPSPFSEVVAPAKGPGSEIERARGRLAIGHPPDEVFEDLASAGVPDEDARALAREALRSCDRATRLSGLGRIGGGALVLALVAGAFASGLEHRIRKLVPGGVLGVALIGSGLVRLLLGGRGRYETPGPGPIAWRAEV